MFLGTIFVTYSLVHAKLDIFYVSIVLNIIILQFSFEFAVQSLKNPHIRKKSI